MAGAEAAHGAIAGGEPLSKAGGDAHDEVRRAAGQAEQLG